MPRVIRVSAHMPVNVRRATAILGSELRAQLLRYYLQHPGPQRDAAEALGVTPKTVSANTQALVDAGVLEATPTADRRSRTYSVRKAELRDVLSAVDDFFLAVDPDD